MNDPNSPRVDGPCSLLEFPVSLGQSVAPDTRVQETPSQSAPMQFRQSSEGVPWIQAMHKIYVLCQWFLPLATALSLSFSPFTLCYGQIRPCPVVCIGLNVAEQTWVGAAE